MSLFSKVVNAVKGIFGKRPDSTTCMEKCPRSIECPQWVILEQHYEGRKPVAEGRCAIAWIPQLLGEIRDAILGKKEE